MTSSVLGYLNVARVLFDSARTLWGGPASRSARDDDCRRSCLDPVVGRHVLDIDYSSFRRCYGCLELGKRDFSHGKGKPVGLGGKEIVRDASGRVLRDGEVRDQ